MKPTFTTRIFSTFLLISVFLSFGILNAQEGNKEINQQLNLLVKQNKLTSPDISNWKLTSSNTSKRSGVKHLYFNQMLNGYIIKNTSSSVHVTKTGKVLSSENNFIKNVQNKIKSTTSNYSAEKTIQSFISKEYNKNTQLIKTETLGDKEYIFEDYTISKKNIPIKFVYFAINKDKVVPTWNFSIHETNGLNWWNITINALNGEILEKVNWSHNCFHGNTKNNHASHNENNNYIPSPLLDNPNESYNVFALPLESPYAGERTLVVNPYNLTASPFGWHDLNGIEGAETTNTTGNNVYAQENGDNIGFKPDGGDDLVFDFPFNPSYTATEQSESAIITNLFYWNNIIHDVYYQYGFDEVSGNFQSNNYNNGGEGSDHVIANGQDGSGECNAMFMAPPDGVNGEMYMFTCGDRDSSVDNGVITHEYTHGLSVRLTGGQNNSDCLSNAEQMGEGWSDWYAIMLTMKNEDTRLTTRPIGNFFVNQPITGPGIRAYPYSTDLSVDPRTYATIYGEYSVHAIGSVWAAMLWEMTWNLIDTHGFDEDIYNGTGGNNMALALVTEALKLQPCNPGFVDGRDAILSADIALYNGENQCLIWEAFAKRGLGFSADQGSSESTSDGVEAFDMPETSLNFENSDVCLSSGVTTLRGGSPLGGVYSGNGVTDDGNGETFTFDPSVVGVGETSITYTFESLCGGEPIVTSTLNISDDIAIPLCQDIEINLDEDGTYDLHTSELVTNIIPLGYNIDQNGTFNPSDIEGTSVSLGDDTVSSALPIGFNFNFFGNDYSEFYISSNGFITFNSNSDSGCCYGQNLPNASTPNNLIAFAWTDLLPYDASISYETTGTTPNQILVIDFNNVPFYSGGGNATAQIKLFERTNRIEIHSTNIGSDPQVTQGIENENGTEALFVEGRNASSWSTENDYVAFYVAQGNQITNSCGGTSTVSLNVNSFDCSNLGENTVIATAIDANGDETQCTSTVNVTWENSEPPVFENCPEDYTILVNENYEIPNFLDELTITDDCESGLTITQSPVEGTIINIGNTVPITITATDNTGNTVNCTFSITVDQYMSITDAEHLDNSIELYPNPSKDQFTIKSEGVLLISLEIYDTSGKLIKTKQVNNAEILVNISELTSGNYLVKIKTEQGDVVKKLIVQ